jgi:hypothetical protein
LENDLESEFLFEIIDYSGIPVVLTRETWHSKAGNNQNGDHPEVLDYLREIQAAIQDPHLVFRSTHNTRCRVFYRLSSGRGRFTGKHIVVVVKYVLEEGGQRGYLSTAYLSRTVYARGERLWPKAKISEN